MVILRSVDKANTAVIKAVKTILNETIKNLSRVLEKNGSLIIAVPNHKSWDAEYYKLYWAAWDVPIHLWHISLDSIIRLFQNHEFKLVKIKPMFFDSFYVSILSEEYKKGRKSFIIGFFIGFISNRCEYFNIN